MCRQSNARSGIRRRLVAGVAALFLATVAGRCWADALDRELVRVAPKLIETLRAKNIKTVGILKFRVQEGEGAVSESAGTLNMFLANRLEIALILANDFDERRQIQVIKEASSVAAKIPGANHKTKEGRSRLFNGTYRLAWGDPPPVVRPDGFLTGIARVSADLRQMSVSLFYFDRATETLERALPNIVAPVGSNALTELGESFVLRGVFDEGKVELADAKAVEQAARVQSGGAKHPLEDANSPVALDVSYDGQPVPISFQEGQASIAEPREGQKVVLTIKRTNAAKGRLAAVLKVNGENTLHRERQQDLHCSKWILEPGAQSISVSGFQKSNELIGEFKILSDPESKRAEFDYGTDVGLISLVVFQEKSKDAPPPKQQRTDEDEDLAAMLRGVHPARASENLMALKARLRVDANGGFKMQGIVVEGKEAAGKIRVVTFDANPAPIVSAVVRYYAAGK